MKHKLPLGGFSKNWLEVLLVIAWIARIRAEQTGLTLVELLGTSVIIILLSLVAMQVYDDVFDRVKLAKSKRDLQAIESALERYRADNQHYPSRLAELVDGGYLRPTTFESPWRKKQYYFYAVDDNGKGNSLAYALGDAGPEATCVSSKPVLHADPAVPLPCGRDPKLPAWSFHVKPTLSLEGNSFEWIRGHASLRQFRLSCAPTVADSCDLKTES